MSTLDKLEIYLEDSIDGKFTTGSLVHGKLVLTLRRSLKVQGIEVKVRGRCRAEWWEGSDERHLYETEEYIRTSIIVYGKAPDRETPHVEYLESGKHVFNFQFKIPDHIPSSFEGMHGYVRYWVKAKIYGVWGLLDQSGKVEFGVERPLDLNDVPSAMDSAEDEDSCVICGCCLNQGAISAFLRINRRGFTPGESIMCDATVYNGSVSSVKSTKLKLYQITTYGDVPIESLSREKWTICEIIRGKIQPGQEERYENEYLKLPETLPVTSLPGCSFIDIDFVVEVDCPKEDVTMRLPILIIVGTVALRGVNITTAQPSTKDIVANTEGIPMPNLPPSASNFDFFTIVPPSESNNQPDSLMMQTVSSVGLLPTGVPPIATKLDGKYPPVVELSIAKREQTLTETYEEARKPRVLRIMSAVKEGSTLEEEEESV